MSATTKASGRLGWGIKVRLPAIMMGLALVAATATGVIGYMSGRDGLIQAAERDLAFVSETRQDALDRNLSALSGGVVALANSATTRTAAEKLSESFQHANVRLWFGRIGERLWISPRFHRLHHAIGIGHESTGRNTLGGANFGVLLPWWDMLFGTANFELRYDATGVRDQVEPGPAGVRDYGRGFWAQQWLGLKRLAGRA